MSKAWDEHMDRMGLPNASWLPCRPRWQRVLIATIVGVFVSVLATFPIWPVVAQFASRYWT